MSDTDRWHWHAYDYAFRRVVLDEREAKSPIDPEGIWFAADLVEAAGAYYAGIFRKSRERDYVTPRPSFGGAVRPGWQRFRAQDLNSAEVAIAGPSAQALLRKASGIIAKAAERWKMAGRRNGDGKRYPSSEIATMPILDEDDPAVQARLREMGE